MKYIHKLENKNDFEKFKHTCFGYDDSDTDYCIIKSYTISGGRRFQYDFANDTMTEVSSNSEYDGTYVLDSLIVNNNDNLVMMYKCGNKTIYGSFFPDTSDGLPQVNNTINYENDDKLEFLLSVVALNLDASELIKFSKVEIEAYIPPTSFVVTSVNTANEESEFGIGTWNLINLPLVPLNEPSYTPGEDVTLPPGESIPDTCFYIVGDKAIGLSNPIRCTVTNIVQNSLKPYKKPNVCLVKNYYPKLVTVVNGYDETDTPQFKYAGSKTITWYEQEAQ